MMTGVGIFFALLVGTLIGMLLMEKTEDSDYDIFGDEDDDYWQQ